MIWKLALIKLNPFGLTNINDKNNFNLEPTFLPDIQGLIPNVNYKGENEKQKIGCPLAKPMEPFTSP